MEVKERWRKIRILFGLLLLGITYSILTKFHISLTGIHQWDGIAGVLIGLYICANPAANVLDVILFRRSMSLSSISGKSEFWFWILNSGVEFTGWLAIVNGLLRFSALR